MAHSGLFDIRSYNPDIPELFRYMGKHPDAGTEDAIVITYENSHGVRCYHGAAPASTTVVVSAADGTVRRYPAEAGDAPAMQ
jgi:hypothetical protein